MEHDTHTHTHTHTNTNTNTIVKCMLIVAFIQGCVSVGEGVIAMDKVSHVQVRGFNIACSRQTAITATSGKLYTIAWS